MLITAIEYSEYRNISKKLDTAKIEEAIDLAQLSDLIEILGDFYFDVVKNAAELSYQDLMNGSTFTYCDDEFEHVGIKRLLGDLTHARFVYVANVNMTPFGMQKKFTNDSEGIEHNLIRDLSKQAQVDANKKFRYIEKYIMSDPVLFSRYCKNRNQNSGSFNSQRFSRL